MQAEGQSMGEIFLETQYVVLPQIIIHRYVVELPQFREGLKAVLKIPKNPGLTGSLFHCMRYS